VLNLKFAPGAAPVLCGLRVPAVVIAARPAKRYR
jgi:hypothetical protein